MPRATTQIAAGAALLAFVFCASVGLALGVREPSLHDEFANLLAGDTFAHGRLANPTPPAWHHFETLHVFFTPSYASKYPPGPGFTLALGQTAGHPILGVWLGTALLCGALAWMLAASFSARWVAVGGLLSILLFAGAGYWSQSYWGGSLAGAGGALVWGAARRWCDGGAARNAALFAVGLVILALSRPFEGLVISLPAVAAVLGSFVVAERETPGEGLARVRRFSRAALPILLAWVAFMGLYNARTTGDPLRLPYQHHEELYATVPLFSFDSARPAPTYRHDELRRFHEDFEGRWLDEQGRVNTAWLDPTKLRRAASFFIGFPGVLAFLALPFALRGRWLWLALAGVAAGSGATVYLATYGGMPHQIAPLAAPLIWLEVACLRRWASLPVRWIGLAVVAIVLLGLADQSLRRVGRHPRSDDHWSTQRARIVGQLEALPSRDLVVVRYGPRHNVHQEWVYNAASLDDAEVVWARSMGPDRDAALLEAFPERRAWRLRVGADSFAPELEPLR